MTKQEFIAELDRISQALEELRHLYHIDLDMSFDDCDICYSEYATRMEDYARA